MVRNKPPGYDARMQLLQRVLPSLMNRPNMAARLGVTYDGKRKLYDALGYPDEKDLTFEYYYGKWKRQDIAAAVIDRPVEKTWFGNLTIVEAETPEDESELSSAWQDLDEDFRIKSTLIKLDKLAGIGHYACLLYGFGDVKKNEDFANPILGNKLELKYIRAFPENAIDVDQWETDAGNERYGQPRFYKLTVGEPGNENKSSTIRVHHSRVLHVTEGSLISDTQGLPRLEPIVNRLVDLEKLLGGDAEMFWRGARPGYSATNKEDYEMSPKEIDALEDELDKYEHDLRRFIMAQGVDITALQQQIADPLSHIDAQLQAISAQTKIPKRILIGSERGELSSGQDRDEWLGVVKHRMEEHAEPFILRPFVNKMMEHGILPKEDEYNVMWEDLFAPSDKEKVEVGKGRSEALKTYSDSPYAAEILPPKLAAKYLLGLTEEQQEEIMQAAEEYALEEDRQLREENELLKAEKAVLEKAIPSAEGGNGVPITRGNRPPNNNQ